MPIRYVKGNILDTDCDIICHSVNFQGVMGAGLARQLKNRYPNIMMEYLRMCKPPYTFEKIRAGGDVAWHFAGNKIIASIFGQNHFGREKRRYTDYISLGNGLNTVRLAALQENNFGLWDNSIAIPSLIGCGLGGGDWTIVREIIEETFSFSPELDVKIYEWSRPQ